MIIRSGYYGAYKDSTEYYQELLRRGVDNDQAYYFLLDYGKDLSKLVDESDHHIASLGLKNTEFSK